MADSTRSMRKSILDRDILPAFKIRLLTEITADDLRDLCNKVKARGAPATAVHVRDIVKQIYGFAILHGEKVANPAKSLRQCADCWGLSARLPRAPVQRPLQQSVDNANAVQRNVDALPVARSTHPTIKCLIKQRAGEVGR